MAISEGVEKAIVKLCVGELDGTLNEGTGFICAVQRDRALILTCYHTIAKARTIRVILEDQEYEALPVREAAETDLVLLSVDVNAQLLTKLKALELKFSSKISEGGRVVALGYPQGSGRIIQGMGTVLRRSDDFIETDAFAHPGVSGGLLLSERGEIVGVITGFSEETETTSRRSFAISIDQVKAFLDREIRLPQEWGMAAGKILPAFGRWLRILLMVLGGLFLIEVVLIFIASPFVDRSLTKVAPQFHFAYTISYATGASLQYDYLEGDIIRISFRSAHEASDGGWVIIVWDKFFQNVLSNLGLPKRGRDFSRFKTLSLRIRGERGGEVIGLGVKDTTGTEEKIVLAQDPPCGWAGRSLPLTISQNWQEVEISLGKYFSPDLDFSLLENISFFAQGCFAAPDPSGMRALTVYIADIRLK